MPDEPFSFKVMTANIWLGSTGDPSFPSGDLPGLDRLACYLSNADIVFLQEVDHYVDRSGRINEPEILAQKSGLTHFFFGGAFLYQGGWVGSAILSRYPLSDMENHTIPDSPGIAILQAVVNILGQRITLFCNHYQHGPSSEDKRKRIATTRFALELINNVDGPIIFGGDLNAHYNTLEVILLTTTLLDSWRICNPNDRHRCGPTSGDDYGGDYILFRGNLPVRKYEAPCMPLSDEFLVKYEKPGISLRDAFLSDHAFHLVQFELVRVPKIVLSVEPSLIPIGRPVLIKIFAEDEMTHAPIVGTINIDGQQVGSTNTPFNYTFVNLGATATITASGYESAGVSFALYKPTLRVLVQPYPIRFGAKMQITPTLIVSAEDSNTHIPVAGRVVIDGNDISSTNIPFTYTFKKIVEKEFDPKQKKWVIVDITYPSGRVTAGGYDDAEIDFGFA